MTENGRRQVAPTPNDTSRSLLGGVKQDDPEAWERFVSLYSPLIYYWCQRMGLPDQEMPDVFQEVFQSVARNVRKFRCEEPGDTLRGWLRTVTRNKVHDHYRRSQKEPIGTGGSEANQRFASAADVDDELTSDEADLQAEHELYMRAIEMIRADFQSKTWDAFWLVVVEGKDASEAAESLGMRPGTVRVAKSRVLKRLREELGDLLE